MAAFVLRGDSSSPQVAEGGESKAKYRNLRYSNLA